MKHYTDDLFINAIRTVIGGIGDDPDRDGLKDTPRRVMESWKELFSGYSEDPDSLFTMFDERCDQMVILKGAEFWSTCEHHMLPFFGVAHVGYLPHDSRVIGVSKLARVVDHFAHRLQIQERMTQEITNLLQAKLRCLGVMTVIEAKHLCMVCRGVQKQQSVMITSAFTGDFESGEVRAEFLSFVNKG